MKQLRRVPTEITSMHKAAIQIPSGTAHIYSHGEAEFPAETIANALGHPARAFVKRQLNERAAMSLNPALAEGFSVETGELRGVVTNALVRRAIKKLNREVDNVLNAGSLAALQSAAAGNVVSAHRHTTITNYETEDGIPSVRSFATEVPTDNIIFLNAATKRNVGSSDT